MLNLAGCAALKESFRGVIGTSTKVLKENRKGALSKSFNYDYFTCYTKALDILKRGGCYVYDRNIKEHLIAVYVSEEDTTPVGLFFSEMDQNNTMVEVVSLSTYAREVVAAKLFSGLTELLRSQKRILPPPSGNTTNTDITSSPQQ